MRFESNAYKQYQCKPSEKFPGFTWCHKEEIKKERGVKSLYPIPFCTRKRALHGTLINTLSLGSSRPTR